MSSRFVALLAVCSLLGSSVSGVEGLAPLRRATRGVAHSKSCLNGEEFIVTMDEKADAAEAKALVASINAKLAKNPPKNRLTRDIPVVTYRSLRKSESAQQVSP